MPAGTRGTRCHSERPGPLSLILIALLAATGRAEESPGEVALPPPVLDVAAPPRPASTWQEYDLEEAIPESLVASAHQLAYERQRPAEAAQLQYFAVQRRPGQGLYQLACYHALAGERDAAFYWLQRAAREEGGVEPSELEADADLADLKEDPRWAPLVEYVAACFHAWVTSARLETRVLVPAGYVPGASQGAESQGAEPLGAVVLLHAYGSSPGEISGEVEQGIADRLSLLVIVPSASIAIGPAKYRWAEQLELDGERVKLALQETGERYPLVPGQVVLAGFSQGAQLAAELLASDPVTYSGAIVLCPGFASPSIDGLAKSPENASTACIIVSGELEKPGNREQARADAEWFERAGAIVVHHTWQGLGHAWPPGYGDHLSVWIQFLIQLHQRAGGH